MQPTPPPGPPGPPYGPPPGGPPTGPPGPPSGSGPSWPPGPPGPPTGSPYYGGGPEGPRKERPAWLVPVGIGAVVGALVGVGIWLVVAGGGDGDEEAVGGTGGGSVTTQEPDATTTEATTTDTTAPPPTGADISLTGTWEGTYVCTQGETGATLTIVDDGGELDAVVEWYEVDSNPGVPPGAYAMEGTISGTEMTLNGTEWIDQPEGYMQAGIDAELVTSGTTPVLEGSVASPSCSDLRLEQTSTSAWYAGTWEGGYDCGQGLTGLTLTIDDVGDHQVDATFEFYEVPENPGVPSGSYRLTGSYADHGLSMDGVEWIDQPDGYVMVGLESDFITRPAFFAGKVTDPSCTAFLLEKNV